jgi:hypothetical protein
MTPPIDTDRGHANIGFAETDGLAINVDGEKDLIALNLQAHFTQSAPAFSSSESTVRGDRAWA